ncbi:MAG: hypothetical protein ABW219_11025 [Ilumatobacteraceae bacterium]
MAPRSAIPVLDGWLPLPPTSGRLQRSMKARRLMHYNRLIALVLGANGVLLVYGLSAAGWWSGDGPALATLAIFAQANLLVAIVPRQQYVVNVVGWLATRPSTRWPRRLRWLLGKYYHLGGLHVGGAVAGTLWYLTFVVAMSVDAASGTGHVSPGSLVTSYLVVTLFVVMIVMAHPRFRRLAHDRFEVTHRFCAWAALVLVWVNTVLFVASREPDRSLPISMLSAPTVWMLVITTLCAIWPWLLLRRVAITIEQPSLHAVVVRLDHGRPPAIGTTRAISRRPLVGWHQFANVPAAAGTTGYRMVISRAGDWTGRFIDEPPSHVWVRGLPTVGVANVRRLFDKVVYVVTGSGIGPALGHLLSEEPSRLVWVTRDPTITYGASLVAEVMAAQPDAVIWDTGVQGKPDVLALAYRTYVQSGADAVICISNRAVTWQVVNGLERCGIPAFGPIWDS